MINVADRVWIGDSTAGEMMGRPKARAVLNVANDLSLKGGWPEVEYAQVGLVDGPGNPDVVYIAAVLMLDTMAAHRDTLVCCHTGGRSVAVAIMRTKLAVDREWRDLYDIFCERAGFILPKGSDAHREAFDRIDWKRVRALIKS